MFRSICAIGIASSALFLVGCKQDAEPAAPTLETNEQKLSYSIGLNFSGQLKQSGIAIDNAALQAGLEDGFANIESRVSAEDIAAAQQAIMQELQAEQQVEFEKRLKDFHEDMKKKYPGTAKVIFPAKPTP